MKNEAHVWAGGGAAVLYFLTSFTRRACVYTVYGFSLKWCLSRSYNALSEITSCAQPLVLWFFGYSHRVEAGPACSQACSEADYKSWVQGGPPEALHARAVISPIARP